MAGGGGDMMVLQPARPAKATAEERMTDEQAERQVPQQYPDMEVDLQFGGNAWTPTEAPSMETAPSDPSAPTPSPEPTPPESKSDG